MRCLTMAAFPGLASPAAVTLHLFEAIAGSNCGPKHYQHFRARCVHRPLTTARALTGATARCRDGTYSFSQNRRGTCSGHGGVSGWL